MENSIKLPSVLPLDPRTYDRALACVHCGLCLPACPTFVVTGHEADSPRGRIQLIRGISDGVVEPTPSVREHLDRCLDCRACETACPSGVVYHELIEEARSRLQATTPRTLQERILRGLFFHVMTHPTRLRLALLPARLLQKVGVYQWLRRSGVLRFLPPQFQKMEQMLPGTGAIWPAKLPERTASKIPGNSARIRIGFFPGCIGSVLFEAVNQKAVDLLAAAGAEVIVPSAQTCCGAIHQHNGVVKPAEQMARRNIDAFLPTHGPKVDYVVSTIAGCGAMLREYDHLLRDDPAYAARAKDFSARVRDISEVLLELGLPVMTHSVSERGTYHDACHLAHAQKVTSPPRALLGKIPGLEMVKLPESDMCCGAAGTYNLTQPEMAAQLAERKLGHITSTTASICVTGNVGCAMQIQSAADARGMKLRVRHPVELLHAAVFGSRL